MIVHVMAFLVIFGLVVYVMLDGFDLGTGIIFPFVARERRGQMMSSIAPFWDGNETWLVYAGGLLFAAFPVIYWVTLSALYIPVFLMLFCLVLRGVSFEFRLKSKTDNDQKRWENMFALGSIGVGFFQGMILGAAVSGIRVINRHFTGGMMDFLTPLSLACGVAVTVAYAILGASWQMYKMEKAYFNSLYNIFHSLLVAMIVLFVFAVPVLYFQRPDIVNFVVGHKIRLIACVVLIVANIGIFHLLLTQKFKHTILYFGFSIVLFALPLVTVLCALYPFAIPFSHTVHDIANTPQALKFVTIVTSVTLPVILCYTGYVYYIFRGKNTENYYS
ncbi:MAG: cytochrome d ubiquinol oxidase subunit II [Proteobacteria bacterium]|nr:cytochrome d ubiquinol oxidase subunit II [Pseudomonadota bacterium]